MTALDIGRADNRRPPAASWWAEVRELSQRAIVTAARQPASWIPGMFFPLMLAAVYSSQFAKVVDLPGFPFPDASFLEFVFIAAVLQGVTFGAINGASQLALDIENGFMDRLLSSPVARSAILVGRLAGSVAFAVVQAVVLLAIFGLFGARPADIWGVIVTVVVAALLALTLGALGSAIALRTGSQEVVQSTFPVVFVMLFVSSAFFPVSFMEGWYGAVARRNPMTWVIDPTRRLLLDGFALGDAAQAVGVAAGLVVAAVLVAFRQLQRRLAAT